jgi:ribonuclease HI
LEIFTKVNLYTDGSCCKTKIAWAYVITRGEEKIVENSGTKLLNNNWGGNNSFFSEYLAVIYGLQYAYTASLLDINLYCDSSEIIAWMKRIKNGASFKVNKNISIQVINIKKNYWDSLVEIVKKFTNIGIYYISGKKKKKHTYHQRCHSLATKARKEIITKAKLKGPPVPYYILPY